MRFQMRKYSWTCNGFEMEWAERVRLTPSEIMFPATLLSFGGGDLSFTMTHILRDCALRTNLHLTNEKFAVQRTLYFLVKTKYESKRR